ncbi:PAS domain S-box protein [Aquabacterium humicola]|uniref:PAS domain S-box protein n=1 Tax=Aquabacterium humicola TaxID=3237377 RepID=UPI002543E3C3|nr:PAS domain S-box protein [Rubrivivax pictus]
MVAAVLLTSVAMPFAAKGSPEDFALERVERQVFGNPRSAVAEASLQLSRARNTKDERAELEAVRVFVPGSAELDEANASDRDIERGLILAAKFADAAATIELLMARALYFSYQQRTVDAHATLDEASQIAAGKSSLQRHRARVVTMRGLMLQGKGRTAEALESFNTGFAIARQEEDRFGMSNALLGMAFANTSDRATDAQRGVGLGQLKAALGLVDEAEYPYYAGNLMHNMGRALHAQGDRTSARRMYEKAMRLAPFTGGALFEANLLHQLARLDLDDDRPRDALGRLARAEPEVRRLGGTAARFRVLLTKAVGLARTGARERSLSVVGEADRLRVEMRAAAHDISFHEAAVAVHMAFGDTSSALRQMHALLAAEKRAAAEANDERSAEMRARFEIERQERENALLLLRTSEADARRGMLLLMLISATALVGGLAAAHQLRLQRRLRTANALKAAIVDHAMDAIVTADPEGRIVEFNPAAEAMFGWSREQVLGQPHENLVPERYRERQRALREQAVRQVEGNAYIGRRWCLRAQRADGSEFPAEAIVWRAESSGGMLFTASLRDITEQQRSAELIERQRNELRQSEKLTTMGSLLAGVAHELNNPLAVVMGRASLLEELGSGTAMQQEAQRVREAAQRCGRIVRTFLNMARQRKAVLGQVQLNDVVRGAAEMLGYVLRTNAIRVELRLAAQLHVVQADGDQLGQVVLNLMVNAQQAMSGVQGLRQLLVETGQEEGRVWLRVADSGPGVPTELRGRIFAPFFTTKSEGVGTGLGLSVSQSIAREHGGDLVLEECAGGGASFMFWLPSTAPQVQVPERQVQLESGAADGVKVLVVDDEPELADVMRTMLEAAGFEVLTAESGAVALEMLSLERFDALVSDIRMPDMDGATLWRKVKERDAALADRMLLVTGDTLSLDVRQFLSESGCQALDKPFSSSELVGAVRQLSYQLPGQ